VSPSHFFNVVKKLSMVGTVISYQSFLGKLKTFYSIYVYLTVDKLLIMIYVKVSVSTKHQRVITFPFISIYYMLPLLTFFTVAYSKLSAVTFVSTSTHAFPFLSSIPKTITLFLLPLPLFALFFPPKYVLSASILPLSTCHSWSALQI
jgi:hypothetical protein